MATPFLLIFFVFLASQLLREDLFLVWTLVSPDLLSKRVGKGCIHNMFVCMFYDLLLAELSEQVRWSDSQSAARNALAYYLRVFGSSQTSLNKAFSVDPHLVFSI